MIYRESKPTTQIFKRLLLVAVMALSLVALTPRSSPAASDCQWECFKEGIRAEQQCYDFWGETIGSYMCATTAEEERLRCHQRTRCPLA